MKRDKTREKENAKELSINGARTVHRCPACHSADTLKATMAHTDEPHHEQWTCRECRHSWDLYVGPRERRPELRI